MGASVPHVRVRREDVLGDVPLAVHGHFTEHLAHIMYDGLWSELLMGRKFESPMVGRRATMCDPWVPFAGIRDDRTHYWRGPGGLPRYASPQGLAHHCQGVVVEPGNDGAERGIAQELVPIDAGTTYTFRGSVRRVGPAGTLKVALRSADGFTVLAEAEVEVPEVNETRFGPDFPHNALWMDDLSWVDVTAHLTVEDGDPAGVFTLTFKPATDTTCLWHFDWVSLMPSDNVEGWHAGVVEALRELPAQSLKWPGGCMADGYDWREGIGDRDTRYGYADQVWATWEDNDVGIDEFMHLCALTGAQPIIGVNGGDGSPEMAAAWVEYCNGSIETTWGARRAANGHPEPYDVRVWVVGNEQWGFFEKGYVGPDQYADRYLAIAEAMKKVDPTITMVAVGQVGEFSRTVLRRAAHAIDQLQIHIYTPEVGFEVTDGPSASRKVASARLFDLRLRECRDDIASVPGAEHVQLCVDEWGWSRSGHAGDLFAAAGLNAMHRAAPLVRIGSRAAVINVDAPLTRVGQIVERQDVYDVFASYNAAHLPYAVRVEVTGDGADDLDVSALVGDDGACSLFLVNGACAARTAVIDADAEDGVPVTVRRHVPVDLDAPAGRGQVATATEPWSASWDLPPLSLTVIQLGAPA